MGDGAKSHIYIYIYIEIYIDLRVHYSYKKAICVHALRIVHTGKFRINQEGFGCTSQIIIPDNCPLPQPAGINGVVQLNKSYGLHTRILYRQ